MESAPNYNGKSSVNSPLIYEEEEVKKVGVGLRKQESSDDPKRNFIFQKQITTFMEDNPPLPLLPKSIIKQAESPRSGGTCNFLKLTRFLGRDHGRSKIKEKAETVEKVSFSHNTTLKSVFHPIPVEVPVKQSLALPMPTGNAPARKKKELQPDKAEPRQSSAKKEKQGTTVKKNADNNISHKETIQAEEE